MLVIKDFATTILASALTAAATSVVVSDASRLPALSAGDYYYLVLQKFTDRTSVEVVKVTGVSGNTLTVVRAQAGTTAKSFAIGDYAEQRITVGTFSEYIAQSVATKVDEIGGYVEQSLGLLNTGDLVKAAVGISYDATNGHGTILSGGEGANKATPYVALRPLGVADSSVQMKYAQDGSLILSGGSRYVETGLLSMKHPTDANGWPNAINSDANNYNNRARGKVHVNNNALYFIADGTFNARRFGIQSGHEAPGYATAYGILDLNPYGGGVRVNGGTVYHTNYVPTPAAVGALALSGGILTGHLEQSMGGYGGRMTAAGGYAYLQGGKVGGDTSDQKLKITGISATALTEFDIITAGHGIARVNGARIYTEQYVPTPAVLGVVPQARTINSKPLTSDITLSAADVGAVPEARTINSKPLTSNITLSAADVEAQPLTRLVRSTNSYLVSASTPQTLLDANGQEVSKISSYLVRLVTTGTSIITGNIYTLRADNGNWILRALARSGTGSNHPELSINADDKPQITTKHPNTYSIVAIMEEFKPGGNHGGRPWFDLESFYSPDNKPTPAALGAVAKSGDTMTGNLTAPAVLVSSAQNASVNALTRKDYVDSAIAAGDALQVSKTGDTMAGNLTAPAVLVSSAQNTSANALTRKDYVDGQIATRSPSNHTHTAADVGALPVDANAVSATKLATARQINGTDFDGSGNITTANWGTARTLTIGDAAKSVNGAGNVSWSLAEIGAVAASDDSYWRYRGGTTNLNDAALACPGYFSFVPGATGIPLTGIYGHGFSIGNGNAAGSGVWYSQIVFGHNNRIYTRNGVDGAATGAWNYFFTSNDKPTPTDIGLSVLSQNSNGLRISLNGKYLDIGARNTSWTHFQTDATSGVYFYNNIAAADVQITSDERLKFEFRPIVGALDKVRSLSGLVYTKKAVDGGATKREAGLIAQAVQRVLPEAAGVGADGFLTLSPTGVIALLVEAIKELEAKLDDCTR